jgi:hypothetical protein
MAEENVGRLYSTQGVDWSDEDAIQAFAAKVHANFVAAVKEAEAAKERGEVREESGYSKWYRTVRDSRIAQAEREAQQERDAQAQAVDADEPQSEEK